MPEKPAKATETSAMVKRVSASLIASAAR